MSTGIIFITAPDANHKVVNRLLLYLKDRQYSSGNRFRIITTRDPSDHQFDFNNNDETKPGDITADSWENPWAGATSSDITTFCSSENFQETAKQPEHLNLFLVLDEQGVRDQSIILCQKIREYEELEVPNGDGFKKVRAPWYGMYMMWCNLDIANMDFEDYCQDQQYEPDKEGWYEPGTMLLEDDDMDEEFKEQRDQDIERLEKEEL